MQGVKDVRAANGDSGLPHTLTHLQFIRPADLPCFRALGVLTVSAEEARDTRVMWTVFGGSVRT